MKESGQIGTAVMSSEDRELLLEVRNLLLQALPLLRGTGGRDPAPLEIINCLSKPDPVAALRERERRVRAKKKGGRETS